MKTTLFAVLYFVMLSTGVAQHHTVKPGIGIATDYHYDSLLFAQGYCCLVESVQKILSPRIVSDDQFQVNAKVLKNLKTDLYAVNIFLPGDLKLVGPSVDEAAILSYAEIVFKRCQQLEIRLLVLGSGGARRIPEGFDSKEARRQFVSISQKLALHAKRYNITIALENLNSSETNFITTVKEALEIVKRVNQPNFKLCADIYHMLKENELPSAIEKAGAYLVHCDIAEKEGRTPPGTKGDDFRPYLSALRKVGYSGKIILECRWENLPSQVMPAITSLQHQLDEVYKP